MTSKAKFLAVGLIAVVSMASGCVSSTLDADQFRAVGADGGANTATRPQNDDQGISQQALQPVDLNSEATEVTPATVQHTLETATADGQGGVDPAARASAIAEMRAKAAAGSGQKTQIGGLPETAASALTAEEQKLKLRELNETASTDVISDSELAAKRASIEQMRRKARRHYEDALNRIER